MYDVKCFTRLNSLAEFDSSCGAAAAVVGALRGEEVSYFTTSAPTEGRENFNNS